ncbi:MAG: hypothetical protein GX075_03515 [Firmicutes bacterium]|nr:hypothetical protein [Bacillota bacterium]
MAYFLEKLTPVLQAFTFIQKQPPLSVVIIVPNTVSFDSGISAAIYRGQISRRAIAIDQAGKTA